MTKIRSQSNGFAHHDFPVTVDQLKSLMKRRGADGYNKLMSDFGTRDLLCKSLKTSPISGLCEDQIDLDRRRKYFGANVIPTKASKSFFRLFLVALEDVTLIILLVAAVISLAVSFIQFDDANDEKPSQQEQEMSLEWIEGTAILFTVFIVMFVTGLNNYTKELQFRKLQDRIEDEHKIAVIRHGQAELLPVSELLVGDICQIKYGDIIPVDGVLIQNNDLKVDESSLTGESALVKKGQEYKDVTLLSGTHIMEGSGRMVVTAVGLNSQTGIIMALLGATKEDKNKNVKSYGTFVDSQKIDLQKSFEMSYKMIEQGKMTDSTKTVLQSKLERLAMQIGYAGITMAAATVLMLITRFSYQKFYIEQSHWQLSYLQYFLQAFIVGITVIVVAVPEGLPLAVTIGLAYAVRKMTKDNNLVRHLDACETMGNATTICSDKTGTLTTNRMTVVQSYIKAQLYTDHYPPRGSVPEWMTNLIAESISINSGYTSYITLSGRPGSLPEYHGNKTECALLAFVSSLGKSFQKIRESVPEDNLVKVYTFNSLRKSMTTVIPIDNGYRVFTKGAPEVVINNCRYTYGTDGQLLVIDEAMRQYLLNQITENMARDGLRTLCIAYKDIIKNKTIETNEKIIDSEPNFDDEQYICSDLTILAVLGIEDPVRPEVPEAIRLCQQAGITVRMVTGDNVTTARSIATKCGIIRPDEDFLVLDSKEFNHQIRNSVGSVDQTRFDKVWPRLRVLARSSPVDKYVLVKHIIESTMNKDREVVAVTGDGTNDGPALKRADVGFAMGIAGTDVAKEACDIIITDDNFSSIVKAVMWGRNVYDSIAKFLQFQLTINLVAVVVAFVGAATIDQSPLKPVQMLWVNLCMDTLASLALATENPSDELLQRKPYGRNKGLLSPIMLRSIFGAAVYQLIVVFALLYEGPEFLRIKSGITDDLEPMPTQHFTMIFNTFVVMSLFNEINARKIHGERNIFKGLFANPVFYIIYMITWVAHVIIIEYGGQAFSTAPLTASQWVWSIVFGVMGLLWHQLILSVPIKWFRWKNKKIEFV